MIYAFIHALISHESSGTNTSKIFFIHDMIFMNEKHHNLNIRWAHQHE